MGYSMDVIVAHSLSRTLGLAPGNLVDGSVVSTPGTVVPVLASRHQPPGESEVGLPGKNSRGMMPDGLNGNRIRPGSTVKAGRMCAAIEDAIYYYDT